MSEPRDPAYRPFFNRRLSPVIRELLANRRLFLEQIAQLTARHFGGVHPSLAARWQPLGAPVRFAWPPR